MKLTEAQVKEANKLLKVLVVKTKEINPDIVASAVIGLCARMCYVAASGDVPGALGFVENMALDIQTMVFNLHSALEIEKAKHHETN